MSDTILRQDAIAIIEAASSSGAWASSHVAVGHVIEAINEMPSQPDPQVTALVAALRWVRDNPLAHRNNIAAVVSEALNAQRSNLMDNPNAFPTANYGAGMTLRDYFAGQALVGILAGGFADTIPHDDISGGADAAFFAYQYADAMLAERTKEQSNG
jgi:hypothetical protein